MSVGVITQARTASTRLPGKVLMSAGGKTLLEHHLDRLVSAGLEVYVATTTNTADDVIVELARDRGLPFHRGSENDVLGRFAGCIEEHDIDTVVRVTSDCPLIDGDLVKRALADFAEIGDAWLYVSNGLQRTWPRGFDFEVFSAQALLDAYVHATDCTDREHVTPFLYQNGSGRMTLRNVSREATGADAYRVTLDTVEDLEMIRKLIEEYGAAELNAEEIIAVLDRHPELAAINAHVEQRQLGQSCE